MIGNNACGSRALGYGRTVDNVEALTVLLADGSVVSTGGLRRARRPRRRAPRHGPHRVRPLRTPGVGLLLRAPAAGERAPVRPLPGRHRGHARRWCSTPPSAWSRTPRPGRWPCWATRRWPTRPTPYPPCSSTTWSRARDSTSASPGWCRATRSCPPGGGWLFAEVTGATAAEAESQAQAVADSAGVPHRIVTDTVEQLALWRIREDGAGLAARSLSRPAQAGWEDAAVPPEKLGAYLRDFDALLKDRALDGVPYGHFGDGCVHVRIDFELEDAGGRGPLPAVRRGRRRPGGVVRRLDVGRARRRPGPLGAAAEDVLTRRRSP